MNLSPEEKEKLEEHAKAIAEILHQNTSSDKLKTFEDIETTLREEIQEQIIFEMHPSATHPLKSSSILSATNNKVTN
ncbi:MULTISPECIES: hypothetical protein [Spirulina sp. CCY15215]|uniref:hypothetical protein n=1 Tax=Spirulina sp. CCY15215 TaxID=2767591 RepID=UPI0019515F7E|nr:hypothetical protein [Spirulina major]